MKSTNMIPSIKYEDAINYSYEDIANLVKEHGQIKLETALAGYNPAFGLAKLRLKPEPGGAPDEYFGDNEDNYPNSVHKLYIEDMDHGAKKLTAEQNKFIFTIVKADRSNPCYDSPYGANHHGLGIQGLTKSTSPLLEAIKKQTWVIILVLALLSILIYILTC